jgi:predicted Zn-dependent protease with MMP-like domain
MGALWDKTAHIARASVSFFRRRAGGNDFIRAPSSEEVEEIVKDAVMHEVGHYFGFDDNEL